MSDTFVRRGVPGGGSQVDHQVKTCGTCEMPMVTRRHYAEMTEVDQARHRPHGSHGNCRSCASRIRFANGATRKSRATGKKRALIVQAEAWREEWDFLRTCGTPINRETARRLGISVATLTAYEDELTTRRTA